MAGATIRRTAAGDAAAVGHLVQQSYAAYGARMDRRPAPMDQDYEEVLRSSESWLAQLRDEIVGVVVTVRYPDHLFIENIAVLPTAQGRGIGSQLLEVAESHAIACGLREVRLYTNELMTENITFYSRRGYDEIDRAEQDGFHRVYFSKAVPATTRTVLRGPADPDGS